MLGAVPGARRDPPARDVRQRSSSHVCVTYKGSFPFCKKSRNFKRKTMLIMLNQLQLPHFESTPQQPPKPASEHITKHISRNMPAKRRHGCILKFKSMTQKKSHAFTKLGFFHCSYLLFSCSRADLWVAFASRRRKSTREAHPPSRSICQPK